MLKFTAPKTRIAVLVAGAMLLPAAAAQADTVTIEGSRAVLTGTPGADSVSYQIYDGQLILSGTKLVNQGQAAGCTQEEFSDSRVSCPVAGLGGLDVRLLGGDDRANGSLYETTAHFATVDLGAGNDYTETTGADIVLGGAGNDELKGWRDGMDNVFEGGEGDDTLTGGGGADVLRGGPGNDKLTGEGQTNTKSADVLDGGEGTDTADDWFSQDAYYTTPATVTLDGRADDGYPGEGDNVTNVEDVRVGTGVHFRGTDGPDVVTPTEVGGKGSQFGLGGNDVLRGTDDDETIDGGAGDDDLRGGYGNDTITGGPGKDKIVADREGRCNEMHCDLSPGSAADTIDAADGEVDTIACGPGNDTLKADAMDSIGPDCESVTKVGAGQAGNPGSGPGGSPSGPGGDGGSSSSAAVKLAGAKSLKSLKAGKLRVQVTGRQPGSSVKVRALRGKKLVATGSGRADTAGAAKVTLRLTKAGRRALRRSKTTKLTIVTGSERLAVSLKR